MNLPEFRTTDEAICYFDDLIEKLQSAREDIISSQKPKSYETLTQRFKSLDAQPKLKFIPTGLFWLDAELAEFGFAEGSFINIAGDSGAGKTFLILQILQQIGLSEKVAFFSFEMFDKVLYRKLKYSKTAFRDNCIFIDKEPFLDTIEAKVRDLTSNHGVRFIAIDSRMKIIVRNQSDEYLKNMTISATLSRICRETGVIILLINQRSNESIKTGKLSLKGGNEQVYDSDMIFYVEHNKETNERLLICDKDRLSENGKKWMVKIPDAFKKEQFNNYGAVSAVEFRG